MEGKSSKTKKIVISIICILLIIIIAIIATIVIFIKNKLDKINYVEIDIDQVEINEGINEQLEGYRTIAILGLDTRYDDYQAGNNRSDCIMLAILNQKTKEISLVSVYRDTYFELPGIGLDKATHAYAYGGAELALSTLNTNLDLDITEFVTVNFNSVVDCVDALGGIELDITSEEVRYINGYIHELNWVTGKEVQDVTTSGRQHVNGVQAVAYSRIRYTAGGDYKRTERMRTVLEKMLEKAKTLSIAELNEAMDKILPKIYTNINSKEILSIIPNIATYKINGTIGWPYETRGATIDGVWYGPAITLESNVKRLHVEVYKQEDYEPTDKVKQISNKIIDKTGYID